MSDSSLRNRDLTAEEKELVGQLRKELPEVVNTFVAAKLLHLHPDTIRRWACIDSGPIRPIKIGRELLWRVSDIGKVLSGELKVPPRRRRGRARKEEVLP